VGSFLFGFIGMGMNTKIRFLAALVIPFLASCSSLVGVAKNGRVPSDSNPTTVVDDSKAPSSAAAKGLPLIAELCSFPSAHNSSREYATGSEAKYCSADHLFGCRKNPLVPELKFPVPDGALSSGFGFRHRVFHSGLDITACKGHPILACADGTVVACGSRKGYRSYGQTVLIDHGRGVFTHYAHASRILVRSGQKVRQGEKIALVGATGRATSPHLHFEVRAGGQLLNPTAYFPPSQLKGIQIARGFFGRPMGPVGSRGRNLGLLSSHR
jgi:murein DD-endopeptidase MepM/ murein hydrolase activator NlpD